MKFQFLLVVFFVCATVGCWGPTVEVVEVTGTVTQDGQPLPEVKILFSPDPEEGSLGQSSQAITDENGNYRLKYKGDSEEFGAEVGWHRVTAIDVMSENSRDDPIPPRISQKYSLAGDTDLKFQVKSGESQTFDFELKSRD